MDEIKRKFHIVRKAMAEDTKGAAIACYSVAFVGLAVALRKVRPFSKFKRPNDIPKLFLQERRELVGVVERIEPNGALLMVNHKPLLRLPGARAGNLPVKIFGVEVTGHGIGWLQTLVPGQEIKFIPVKRNTNFVECEVTLPQLRKGNKLELVNVGESLMSIGFGKIEAVEKSLLKHKDSIMYYNKLKAAQNQLERKTLGIKYYIQPTKLLLQSVYTTLSKLMARSIRIPKSSQTRKNAIKLAAT